MPEGRGGFYVQALTGEFNSPAIKGAGVAQLAPMYHKLCSWENLLQAYRKAAKGKRGKAAAASFEHRLEENLMQLQGELMALAYRPDPYSSFYIHEPKRRLISAALFRDRVVHHALCNIIEPAFERSFIHDSYANRVGKGTHRALDRAQHFARKYRYFMHCDVQKFFPSIDHAVLRHALQRKVGDEKVLWLIDSILASGECLPGNTYIYFQGDDLFDVLRPTGLPIGNLTSQFWANVYLNPLDHFVKRELGCKAYIRYVDDMLLFAQDKKVLWQWKNSLIKRLTRIRLVIHPKTQPMPVREGISFLGFVIFPERRRLKRRKGVYYRRKLRHLLEQPDMEALSQSVQGWLGHVRYANTVGLQHNILQEIPDTILSALKLKWKN